MDRASELGDRMVAQADDIATWADFARLIA
jgi:hypothetical protein